MAKSSENYDETINLRTYKHKKAEYIIALKEKGTDMSKDLNQHIDNVIEQRRELLVQSSKGE